MWPDRDLLFKNISSCYFDPMPTSKLFFIVIEVLITFYCFYLEVTFSLGGEGNYVFVRWTKTMHRLSLSMYVAFNNKRPK